MMEKEDVRYYVKHPNGRERLRATTDAAAVAAFKKHWSAKATWIVSEDVKKPRKRELIKEVRSTILIDNNLKVV